LSDRNRTRISTYGFDYRQRGAASNEGIGFGIQQ
jgi:hypothetical protein